MRCVGDHGLNDVCLGPLAGQAWPPVGCSTAPRPKQWGRTAHLPLLWGRAGPLYAVKGAY
jgi:hypothetical protein